MTETLWAFSRILGVKPNKREGLVRRVRVKTNSTVLEKIVLLEAPRLHAREQLNIIDLNVIIGLKVVSI